MRTSIVRSVALLALAASFLGSAHAQKKPEPLTKVKSSKRVVVLPFDPKCNIYSIDRLQLGHGLKSMLEYELIRRSVFVLDRTYMAQRIQENTLGDMGIADSSTVAKLGRELGAQYQISVEVLRFGEETGRIGGGIFDRFTGAAGVQITTSKARVELSAKLMDVESGRILAMCKESGEESKSSVSLGASKWWDWAARVNYSSSEWLESRLGKASSKAMEKLAESLAKQWPDVETAPSRMAADGVSFANLFGDKKEPQAERSWDNLKGYTFMVFVPETILSTPRVPDPAAQTEIEKAMIRAGLTVKDDQRVRQLVKDTEIEAMFNNTISNAELHQLRQRVGVDVLIVGEAIASANNVQLANQPRTYTRARVEVKAIMMDTGVMLASEEETQPGSDLSDVIANKAALKNAGAAVAPKLLDAMAATVKNRSSAPASSSGAAVASHIVEIEIGGWASRSDAQEFLEALKGISGVLSARRKEFTGGTLFAEVTISKAIAEEFGVWIESNSSLKKFGIRVDTDSTTKIKGKIG